MTEHKTWTLARVSRFTPEQVAASDARIAETAEDLRARRAHAEVLVQAMDYRPVKMPAKLLALISTFLAPLDVVADEAALGAAFKAHGDAHRVEYYASHLTLAELVEAVAFYQSGVGQKLLAAALEMTDVSAIDEAASLEILGRHVKNRDGTPVDLTARLAEMLAQAQAASEEEMGAVEADEAEAAQAHAEEAESKPRSDRRHEWDRGGERCLRCGAKDWMNIPECPGGPTNPAAP